MRIVFLTELSHKGGVDTFLAGLIRHWPQAEDELWLFTNASHPGLPLLAAGLGHRARVEAHGVPVYVDRILSASAAGGRRRWRWLAPLVRLLDAFRSYRGFRRLFQRLAPDRLVIVTGGYPGGDSCRIAALAWAAGSGNRAPALFNIHNLAVPPARWNVVEQLMDRALAATVGQFVAVSRACAESMRVRPAIDASGKVRYILNGIDTQSCDRPRPELRAELGFDPACGLVLMLATYEPRKGHAFLFASFKQVLQHSANARLVVCGYGYPAEIDRVRTALDEAGIADHVTLLGYREDTAQLLAAADVLVVPSQGFESFGLTCVEAMAAGVPVVATRVGGLPEVVENGDGGYCVDPRDTQAFAACVTRLLEDQELRREQGMRGKARHARLFTAGRMAREYADLIRNPENTAAIMPPNPREQRRK